MREFLITIKSSFGRLQYWVGASSSIAAWEKAADYCGDLACAITVMPARSAA